MACSFSPLACASGLNVNETLPLVKAPPPALLLVQPLLLVLALPRSQPLPIFHSLWVTTNFPRSASGLFQRTLVRTPSGPWILIGKMLAASNFQKSTYPTIHMFTVFCRSLDSCTGIRIWDRLKRNESNYITTLMTYHTLFSLVSQKLEYFLDCQATYKVLYHALRYVQFAHAHIQCHREGNMTINVLWLPERGKYGSYTPFPFYGISIVGEIYQTYSAVKPLWLWLFHDPSLEYYSVLLILALYHSETKF